MSTESKDLQSVLQKGAAQSKTSSKVNKAFTEKAEKMDAKKLQKVPRVKKNRKGISALFHNTKLFINSEIPNGVRICYRQSGSRRVAIAYRFQEDTNEITYHSSVFRQDGTDSTFTRAHKLAIRTTAIARLEKKAYKIKIPAGSVHEVRQKAFLAARESMIKKAREQMSVHCDKVHAAGDCSDCTNKSADSTTSLMPVCAAVAVPQTSVVSTFLDHHKSNEVDLSKIDHRARKTAIGHTFQFIENVINRDRYNHHKRQVSATSPMLPAMRTGARPVTTSMTAFKSALNGAESAEAVVVDA